ncbi:capsular polysaccharide synthesis protein [Ruegeria sediminis]|uniref:capsular polysaccharide synthesis protein n=1 Tax=Ruegeria sediminis TaxID=2583820 RepID=UPI001486C755|nr:capsular polysaccharide synthesis protein [Ruegeria sediminis]
MKWPVKYAKRLFVGVLVLAGNSWLAFFVFLFKGKQLRSFARRVIRKAGMPRPDGFEKSIPRTIPRNIWIFWDTGIDNAPEVVRMCIESWKTNNPNWTVQVLSKETVAKFVDMPPLSSEISIQSYSDLLRLKLLKERGGAWADATTFCVKPLDEWLPVLGQRGFFAFFWTRETRWFTWPGITREVATWFLAAEPNHPVVSDWCDYSIRYLDKRRNPHTYFWCHTLFELLIYLRRPFRKALCEVPKIGCFGPHLVHDCVMRQRDLPRAARILERGAAPVQKLRWQWHEEQLAIAKSVLQLSSAEASGAQASED